MRYRKENNICPKLLSKVISRGSLVGNTINARKDTRLAAAIE
jgi:hypothetical protein